MNRLRLSLGIALLAVGMSSPYFSWAQELTGDMRFDLLCNPSDDRHAGDRPFDEAPEKRSVPIAVVLSALVPGSGQVYAGTPWWRPLLYGAIEVAGWIGYGVWTGEGNSETTRFQEFADRHWDVTRYVEWIRVHYPNWSDDDIDRAALEEALANVIISTDPALPPWQRVDFDQLNRIEDAVRNGFSHTLPRHGEQQYYEEIGKYIQYRSGWDDHPFTGDSLIFDPGFVTARNQDYTLQRKRANDLLAAADHAIAVIVLNHLISMVDAGIAAHGVNVSCAPVVLHSRAPGTPVGFQVRITVDF